MPYRTAFCKDLVRITRDVVIHTESKIPYKIWIKRHTDLYFCMKITSIRTVDKFQGKFGKVICESVHVTRQKHIINGAPAAPTSICVFF